MLRAEFLVGMAGWSGFGGRVRNPGGLNAKGGPSTVAQRYRYLRNICRGCLGGGRRFASLIG